MGDTHSGYEEFLDLVDGPLELDLGTVVCVLHGDQDVEVLVEVLPVGLTPVHLLLKHKNRRKKTLGLFECASQTHAFLLQRERRGETGFHFSSALAGILDRLQTPHKQTCTKLKVI